MRKIRRGDDILWYLQPQLKKHWINYSRLVHYVKHAASCCG